MTYLPVLLQDAFDLDVQGAGYFTTWPLIGVVLGALAGGRVVDIVLVKTRSHRLSRGAVGFIVLALCGFFTAASVWSANGYTILGLTPAQQFAGCNAIAAFFFGISAPCAWAATIDLGRDNTAVLTGFLNAAGNMAGVLITPLVGMLLDYLLQFEGSWIWLIHLHAAFHLAAAITWWPIRLPEPQLESQSPESAV